MHCNHLPLDKLPQTFRDAIIIVRAIGLRYLWIDSLCIIQDSLEDWHFESSRMAEVYTDAYITIAADLADHSDAGLFITDNCSTNRPPRVRQFSQVDDDGTSHQIFIRRNFPVPGRPRDHARSCYASEAVSKLGSRGWAFQENILSRRILHFTNAELVWECLASHECSCGGHVSTTTPSFTKKRDLGFILQPFVVPGGRSHNALSPAEASYVWQCIVADFSRRQLTYLTDRLPALSGLAKTMPFPEVDYLAGLWAQSLIHDLIWINGSGRDYIGWEYTRSEKHASEEPPSLDSVDARGRQTARTNSRSGRISGEYAPTWSWASISGTVAYGIMSPSIAGVVHEWSIIAAICTPVTSNPYGSVSRDSWLQAEGYVVPIGFTKQPGIENVEFPSSIRLRLDRMDGSFSGPNKVWMDAGIETNEWGAEGHEYYVLVIGCRAADGAPLALILRDKLDGTGQDEYTRIGMACLDNWAGREWRVGGRRRVVTIF